MHQLNEELEQRVLQRTEELQAAYDHLKVLSKAKDEFVSNVSHELRTPITNMKLYHYLLRARADKSEHYLDILRRDIDRLESLIEALLILSRFDQERQTVSLKPLNLKALLERFISDRKALAAAKDISLELHLSDAPSIVEADQQLLEQALSIFVTNALAYTPSNGVVCIKLEHRVSNDKSWAGFSVYDTGPGIPPDERNRLFERFFRGSTGRDSGVPGTGLGLSIAKEIVDKHHGFIEVRDNNDFGRGSVFSVWLQLPA